MVKASTVGSYVDGNSPADLGGYYSWSCTPDNSTTLRSPGNAPGSTLGTATISGSGTLMSSGIYALTFGFVGKGIFGGES